MEGKQSESEIVIKITPKNLERLIYILIIIGLLIFSVVQFNKKAGDCPKVQCNSTQNKTAAAPVQQPAAPVEEEPVQEQPEEDTTSNSGTVEFILTGVQLCITNQTLDKGRFDTVSVSIKNGLDRQLNARVDLFLWDTNDPQELQQYPAQKIEKIRILPGAQFIHTYDMTGGMFTELTKEKTVKAVLYDTDLSKKLGEQTKTNIKPLGAC